MALGALGLRRWPLALALLYLLALPTPAGVYNGAVLALAAGGLALLICRPRGSMALAGRGDLVLIFACLWLPMLLASLDALDPGRAAASTALYLRFLLLGVLTLWAVREPRALGIVELVVVGLCLAWTADALLQLGTGRNLLGYPYGGGQLQGIFYPKHQLGVVLCVFTPVLLDRVARLASARPAWWLIMLPVGAVVALTLHRNSWVMFLLACALYFGYRCIAGRWRPSWKALAVGAALTLLLVTGLTQHHYLRARAVASVGALFESPQRLEAQLGQRPDIWRTALSMARDNWLNGVGPRGFRNAYEHYAGGDDYWLASEPPKVPAHPHQIVLEIAAETGLFGLLGYGLVFVILVRRFVGLDGAGRARAAPWVMAVVIAMFPLNIHKAFYGFFVASLVWWILAMAIASLHVAPIREPDGRDQAPRSGPPPAS